MAYIMFVGPKILAGAGMDQGAVFVATCLSAAITTLHHGAVGQAAGGAGARHGAERLFRLHRGARAGGNWQLALGCVFLSGILFVADLDQPGARMADQRASPKA